MRTDYAPADAPFSNADLARNFERIVFFSEFTLVDGALVARERETPLVKWRGPIRYALAGDAVTARDVATYAALAERLSRVTGLDIAAAAPGEQDNLLILILSRPARRSAAEFLEMLDGEASEGLIYRLKGDDWEIPCAATVGVNPTDPVILQGVILIKAETTGLLRESCAHEEFAQALGPGNDFFGARPSIFNDDGEFALLTEHDEYLLRVLYDDRLRSGMRRHEAMPIVREVISELRPEGGPV
ncbi:MAG: DUF2927 domain-containing protein [Rubrimonas sp.]|uniref:DUF2927 domain-containing protein n=1 Tax=Rubrimonas sp. TaxID=2036015 RepID=UPI002FDEEA8C